MFQEACTRRETERHRGTERDREGQRETERDRETERQREMGVATRCSAQQLSRTLLPKLLFASGLRSSYAAAYSTYLCFKHANDACHRACCFHRLRSARPRAVAINGQHPPSIGCRKEGPCTSAVPAVVCPLYPPLPYPEWWWLWQQWCVPLDVHTNLDINIMKRWGVYPVHGVGKWTQMHQYGTYQHET